VIVRRARRAKRIRPKYLSVAVEGTLAMAEKTVELDTTGMHCQSCAMLIDMSVGDLEGVSEVKSDYAAGTTEVTFDDEKVGVDGIIGEIVKAGYAAELKGD
jgi:copper chaperone